MKIPSLSFISHDFPGIFTRISFQIKYPYRMPFPVFFWWQFQIVTKSFF